MRRKLDYQADRIEAVLTINRIPARVTGGTVTPRWIRFRVLPALGARIARIKQLDEELAAALNVPSCRIFRRGAAISVEIPRDDPRPVRLLPLLRQLADETRRSGKPLPPMTATLGLSEEGVPLLIRLPSPNVAHILVAGTTGSGKTALLRTMVLSLALSNPPPRPNPSHPDRLALLLFDPKGTAFTPFANLPHLARPLVREVAEMQEALASLVRWMEMRSRTGSGKNWPHVVVVIDELADLLLLGGKPVQHALTRLTQRGREAGIHILAATQKPTAAALGSLVTANFPVRLVGRVVSATDARTAAGRKGTGAERLLGRGDFLAVAEGDVVRFQAAHVTTEELRSAVRNLNPQARRGRGFRPTPPLRLPEVVR